MYDSHNHEVYRWNKDCLKWGINEMRFVVILLWILHRVELHTFIDGFNVHVDEEIARSLSFRLHYSWIDCELLEASEQRRVGTYFRRRLRFAEESYQDSWGSPALS